MVFLTLSDLFFFCQALPYSNAGVSASYALRRQGDTLYLFFQGSDGRNDWKRNLDFPAEAYKRGGKTVWYAHRGFLQVWKELEPVLAPSIADPQIQHMVIAGFSHGAAVAVLCHEYVWYHRKDLRNALEGYGFGCPRVFWGRLTPNLKRRWANFTVIRNRDDLVTHLPPWLFGYRHVGTLRKIGTWWKYTPIDAHRPENYQEELQAEEKSGEQCPPLRGA